MTSSMRIATFNLRYDSKPDGISVSQTLKSLSDPLTQPSYMSSAKEQPWSLRRVRVAESLLSQGIVLAGLQEALVRQVNDLAELLGSDWAWVGVGRENGVSAGEFSPIFYKKTAVALQSSDCFWLSGTPFKPSKFPGAGSYRVATVGRFTLLDATAVPKSFTVLNTHLDNQSDEQRKVAASLLLIRARFEAATTHGPVLITGDFNSTATGRDSGAYRIITGDQPPVAIDLGFAARYAVPAEQLPNFHMLDLRGHTPRERVSANFATFTGFRPASDTSQWARIDFIFGGSNLGWASAAYTVLSALADDGVLASDHRLVLSDVSI